jgi:hypothetical protein
MVGEYLVLVVIKIHLICGDKSSAYFLVRGTTGCLYVSYIPCTSRHSITLTAGSDVSDSSSAGMATEDCHGNGVQGSDSYINIRSNQYRYVISLT